MGWHVFRTPGLCFALLLTLGAGCGSSNKAAAGDAGDGPECDGSEDCTAPEVCEPVSQTCVAPGEMCTGHADCTGDTYCDPISQSCLPSAVGTPCASDANCDGSCIGGFCGCSGVAHERNLEGGPLDIYMVLDRTGSMGADCAYDPVGNPAPPVASKACYATYALADYLTSVSPSVDTKLAFSLMSLSNDCTGASYDPALIVSTSLPVSVDSPLVQRISDEDFSGGFGTRIEGALRGIATYTAAHEDPAREMIGVLITDGDATQCQLNNGALAQILADHLAATGIRTFIIGMEGATEANLEELAIAGGADPHNDFCGTLTPPCHYWNVGNGSGPVLADALQAISDQAAPLPCDIDVTGLTPPEGEELDFSKVNVTLSDGASVSTIPQVDDSASCPAMDLAWYYDNPAAPTQIHLCQYACDTVTAAGDGANLNVVAGCADTVVIVD